MPLLLFTVQNTFQPKSFFVFQRTIDSAQVYKKGRDLLVLHTIQGVKAFSQTDKKQKRHSASKRNLFMNKARD